MSSLLRVAEDMRRWAAEAYVGVPQRRLGVTGFDWSVAGDRWRRETGQPLSPLLRTAVGRDRWGITDIPLAHWQNDTD